MVSATLKAIVDFSLIESPRWLFHLMRGLCRLPPFLINVDLNLNHDQYGTGLLAARTVVILARCQSVASRSSAEALYDRACK